jgi:toxin secretion/phage lysis holin
MEKYLNLLDSKCLKILIVFIVLDVLFGVFRALIEKGINSTIGIDGIIRKVAMIVTIVVCLFLDYLIEIDLISFLKKVNMGAEVNIT